MARILIVDDEPGIGCLLERLLEEQGHKVVLAENGWSGLELFCRESPEVIVLDLNMPGIAGFTALQQIRRLNPGQAVIILTGDTTEETEQQVRALGVKELVEKESAVHLLDAALKRVLLPDLS